MCFYIHNNDPHRTLDLCALKSVFLGYYVLIKDKHHCPQQNYYIISVDVIFFESKPYFDTKSHSSKSNPDFLHLLVQEHFAS